MVAMKMREELSSAKPLAQTTSDYKGRFLQIKLSNKTYIACEVDRLELWKENCQSLVSEVRSRIL